MTKMNNNIKLNFLHVCDYASFSVGGKLNILGIFKNINTPKVPVVHPQLFVVTNITITKPNNAGNYKEIIKIVDNEGDDILKPLEFNLKPSSNKERPGKKKKDIQIGVVAEINNIQFSKEGNYKVQVNINGKLIGETSLTVTLRKR